jgi:uracil-DNA glycosylase family 4
MNHHFAPPPPDCSLCPRLVAFRADNKAKFPHFYNGAVPPFGALDAQMLVVGLAPGLKGANATGRPFTGDYAGEVLYSSLQKMGMARGEYQRRADDGFELMNVRISNAVRCVPPENKPTPEEARTCNPFLVQEIAAMPNLKLILSLGSTSHQAVLRTLKLKQSAFKFGHGALHDIGGGRMLMDSYHTSRYNISTGCLTQEMFDKIIENARDFLHRSL